MSDKIYRPEKKHPESAQQDLNPDASKGTNWGLVGPHPEKDEPRTAKDIKELHRMLQEFHDDELDDIPILPSGARLESNATYINLRDEEPHEFTAEGYEEAKDDDWIVPKAEVDYQLWHRLRNVRDPSRTGEQ